MAASMTFMMVLVLMPSQATAYSSTTSDCKTGACVTQNDDAMAMMQRAKAKVTLDVQTSTEDTALLAKSAGMGSLMQARATERLAAAQKMESSMETAVMKMISGTGPTLPPEIFESIFTEMELIRKELLGEKDGLQTEINDANEVVANCNENMQDTQSGAVATAKGHSDASKATHHTCRAAESSAYDAKNSSCIELASKTDTISKAAPQCNCPLSDIDTSAVLTCLASNRNWVASYETDLKTQKSDCDLKTTTWSSKADVCDSDQSNYELAFCSYAEAIEDMCSALDTCYSGAIASRNSTLYAVEMEEKHIKAVLASAKKIVCFLSILNKSTTENLTMGDFEACKNMNVSSDRTYLSSSVPDLDITYPPADAKEACQTLTSTPGDGQWADAEYSAYTQAWLRETAVCLHMTTTTSTSVGMPFDSTSGAKFKIEADAPDGHRGPLAVWGLQHGDDNGKYLRWFAGSYNQCKYPGCDFYITSIGNGKYKIEAETLQGTRGPIGVWGLEAGATNGLNVRWHNTPYSSCPTPSCDFYITCFANGKCKIEAEALSGHRGPIGVWGLENGKSNGLPVRWYNDITYEACQNCDFYITPIE